MNAASWIILAVVVAWVAWTVKSRLFKSASKRRGGCCDIGDADAGKGCACGGCTGCDGCGEPATRRNAVLPIVKEAPKDDNSSSAA